MIQFACLAGFLLSNPAWAQQAPEKILDILNLEIIARVKEGYDTTVASLRVGAILNEKNDIIKFEVVVYTDEIKPIQVPLSAIANKSYPVKVKGIELGAIAGLKMSASGEGTLRIVPKSNFLAAGMPSSLDISLRRLGPNKKWAIMRGSEIITAGIFRLSKHPSKMNGLELMFSAPKLTDMKIETANCKKNLPSLAVKYRSLEALNTLGCDIKKASLADIGSIALGILSVDSIYTDFYVRPNDSKKEVANFARSAQQLAALGIDIRRLEPSYFMSGKYYIDPMRSPVSSGHMEGVHLYLDAGFKPTQDTFESALLQVYQVDLKKGVVVTSNVAAKILNLLKQSGSYDRPNVASMLASLFDYQDNQTLMEARLLDKNYYYSFTSALLNLLDQEGADFNGKDDLERTAIDLVGTATQGIGDDGYEVLFSKQEGQALIEKIRALGAK